MKILIILLLVLGAFMFMEFMAWFTHKYVMHGFLWSLHKDHHTREHKAIEWNDLFALIFAVPSIVLIFTGVREMGPGFWIGIGIALYGLAYFTLHDVLVHRRLKILDQIDNWYFRAIVKAHNDHHAGKKNYGFIMMIPWKYFRKQGVAERGKY
ncbi:MAG TPA: sterol desaturase family protein [Bacteroidales bacterium]|nr:sterol desaturase family protein [Bacteroidales bacterium]